MNKQYTYRGSQNSLSIGGHTFPVGVAVVVALAAHELLKHHPVIKALEQSGSLDIADVPEEQEVAEQDEGAASTEQDYSKLTVVQLKELLTAENIFFESDAKKADLIALLTNASS